MKLTDKQLKVLQFIYGENEVTSKGVSKYSITKKFFKGASPYHNSVNTYNLLMRLVKKELIYKGKNGYCVTSEGAERAYLIFC